MINIKTFIVHLLKPIFDNIADKVQKLSYIDIMDIRALLSICFWSENFHDFKELFLGKINKLYSRVPEYYRISKIDIQY